MDILDYITKRSDRSFEELPLNQLDIAIFNEINYLVFKDFLTFTPKAEHGLTMSELAENYHLFHQKNKEKSTELFLAHQARLELLDHVSKSLRFKTCRIFAHQDIFDAQQEIQFSASSFFIEDTILVVYRGTDSSLTGWKEDFNLAYLEQIPSQKFAVEYLQTISSQNSQELILSGHSKGGNLALYAAKHLQQPERIQAVYLFDAPGLSVETLQEESYQLLLPKLHAFRPVASVVGVLFDKQTEETIVQSAGISLMQHLLLLWQVDIEKNVFKIATKTSQISDKIAKISQHFLKNNTKSANRRLINLLYRIIQAPKEKLTWREKLRSMAGLLHSASQAEREAIFFSFNTMLSAIQSSDIRSQRSESEYLRSRQTFLSALYLPEQIAQGSKYLALLVIFLLGLTLHTIYLDQKLNLIIFSCLFFLCSLATGYLSLRAWRKAKNKLTWEYLPGLSSLFILVNILYQTLFGHFTFNLIENALPHSFLFLLILICWHMSYQYFKTKASLPEIASWLKNTAIFCAILIAASLLFPTFLNFIISWLLIFMIGYKIIAVLFIAYHQWRK